jgi:hypothetical protein
MSLSRMNVAAVRALRKRRNDGVMPRSVGGEGDGDDDTAKSLPVAQKTTTCCLSGGRVLPTD